MSRWEYCTIILSSEVIGEDQVEEYKTAGEFAIRKTGEGRFMATSTRIVYFSEDKDSEQVEFLNDTIRELGEAGWEMISHASTKPNIEHFFFKRPILD